MDFGYSFNPYAEGESCLMKHLAEVEEKLDAPTDGPVASKLRMVLKLDKGLFIVYGKGEDLIYTLPSGAKKVAQGIRPVAAIGEWDRVKDYKDKVFFASDWLVSSVFAADSMKDFLDDIKEEFRE